MKKQVISVIFVLSALIGSSTLISAESIHQTQQRLEAECEANKKLIKGVCKSLVLSTVGSALSYYSESKNNIESDILYFGAVVTGSFTLYNMYQWGLSMKRIERLKAEVASVDGQAASLINDVDIEMQRLH